MKVLLLHQHFNTPEKGGGLRSYYLAKALVDKGYTPIVVAAHNSKTYKKENLEGIEVHYLPVPYDNRFGFYKRSVSFMQFVSGAVKLAAGFRDVRVCYAISVPLTVGLAAMRIKSKFKIPFVFEVGDLWPEAPIQMGFIKNSFFKKALYRLEKRIYKSADSVVALSTAIQDDIKQKLPQKQLHLIPNMADTNFYQPEQKLESLEKKYGVEGKFVVSYLGALGIANGLDYLLECARACEKMNANVHFILCGDGAMLDSLKHHTKQLGLKNLSILPLQNRDGVREIMNVTDATFVCYKPVPVLETGSPNKYFDGLAAGKLIIINFGGWIKNEIEKERCGVYINPKEPDGFVNAVMPFVESKDLLKAYQTASHALAEREYSRELLSKKYVSIFNRYSFKSIPDLRFDSHQSI